MVASAVDKLGSVLQATDDTAGSRKPKRDLQCISTYSWCNVVISVAALGNPEANWVSGGNPDLHQHDFYMDKASKFD